MKKIELLLGGGRDGHLPTPTLTPPPTSPCPLLGGYHSGQAPDCRASCWHAGPGLQPVWGQCPVFLPTWEPVCGVGKDRPPSLGPSWGSSSLCNSRVLSRGCEGWDPALSPSPTCSQEKDCAHSAAESQPQAPPVPILKHLPPGMWGGGGWRRLSHPSHRHGLKLWLLLNPEPEGDSPRVPGTREPDPWGQEHKQQKGPRS